MARAKPLQSGSPTYTFTAVIEPDEEDGGYVVTFPAIPDLATQGETLAEAHLMAEDCLCGYLEVLRETGRPMPTPGRATPSAHATIIELQIPVARPSGALGSRPRRPGSTPSIRCSRICARRRI